MKVGEFIDYLMTYSNDDEICIEVYETITNQYIDSTYDIVFKDDFEPTLKINVEKGKFNIDK